MRPAAPANRSCPPNHKRLRFYTAWTQNGLGGAAYSITSSASGEDRRLPVAWPAVQMVLAHEVPCCCLLIARRSATSCPLVIMLLALAYLKKDGLALLIVLTAVLASFDITGAASGEPSR